MYWMIKEVCGPSVGDLRRLVEGVSARKAAVSPPPLSPFLFMPIPGHPFSSAPMIPFPRDKTINFGKSNVEG